MSALILKLIAATEQAMASATSPAKKARLARDLESYKFTQSRLAADGGDDDDGDEDDKDDDSKAKKAAEAAEAMKKKAEAMKHRAKAAEYRKKAAEAEEDAKKAEGGDDDENEDEDEEAEESVSVLTPGASAAISGSASAGVEALARVAKLEKVAEEREKQASVAQALAERRITPNEAKSIAKKSASFVSDFLGMRPHAIVNTDEQALVVPDGKPHADLSEELMSSINTAIVASQLTGDAADKMRSALIKSHREQRAVNGAGRY